MIALCNSHSLSHSAYSFLRESDPNKLSTLPFGLVDTLHHLSVDVGSAFVLSESPFPSLFLLIIALHASRNFCAPIYVARVLALCPLRTCGHDLVD